MTIVIKYTSFHLPNYFTFFFAPGVYIPADCKEVHEEFRGLGIRIEDDILCTNHGLENLTKDCRKYVHELTESEPECVQ